MLVLHAEKGLVRAGTPDLTLFHQVHQILNGVFTIVTIFSIETIVTIVTLISIVIIVSIVSTNHQEDEIQYEIDSDSYSALLSFLGWG